MDVRVASSRLTDGPALQYISSMGATDVELTAPTAAAPVPNRKTANMPRFIMSDYQATI